MGTFISTKGRYAIRLLIDLAEHADGERIPLKDVAERQCISLKYLETFMPSLVKAGLVPKKDVERLVSTISEHTPVA